MLAAFGALAVILALLTVVNAAVLVGVLVMGAGGVQLLQAVRGPELKSRIWHGALAAVYLIGALLLLFRIGADGSGLWLALAAFFLADGGVRLMLGYRRSDARVSLWLIASGVASVAIALLIYFVLSDVAGWRLGLLVGAVLLLVGGFLMWLSREPAPPETAPAPTPPPTTEIIDPI